MNATLYYQKEPYNLQWGEEISSPTGGNNSNFQQLQAQQDTLTGLSCTDALG